MNSSPMLPQRLIHRMSCPHCGDTLRRGTARCPNCFGKIAYCKAPIRNRVLRVVALGLILCTLVFSDTTGRADPVRIVFNFIIFTVCAVGLWNHRSPDADAGKSDDSDV